MWLLLKFGSTCQHSEKSHLSFLQVRMPIEEEERDKSSCSFRVCVCVCVHSFISCVLFIG